MNQRLQLTTTRITPRKPCHAGSRRASINKINLNLAAASRPPTGSNPAISRDAPARRVHRRVRRELEIADIGAPAGNRSRNGSEHNDIGRDERGHAESADENAEPSMPAKRVKHPRRWPEIIDQASCAGPSAAGGRSDRRTFQTPGGPGILGVELAVAVAQTNHEGAAPSWPRIYHWVGPSWLTAFSTICGQPLRH